MKAIINNRMYDTDNAEEICLGEYGNFNSKVVTLYRKKTGEYFYENEISAYGHIWIEPTTEKDAKEFAQQVMTADEYEAYFGEVEE